MTQKNTLAEEDRLLTISQVLEKWPVSRQVLWRLTNDKREAHRLPSYKIGGKRLFKYAELMWYLDNHKTTPQESPRRRSPAPNPEQPQGECHE